MSLDFYGFPLQLSSAHQAAARQRCDAAEMKQEKAWAKYAKKNQAPVDDTRKKLCRKVIFQTQMNCLHELLLWQAPCLYDRQCPGMPLCRTIHSARPWPAMARQGRIGASPWREGRTRVSPIPIEASTPSRMHRFAR